MLRIVIYLQLLYTIFVFYMVHAGPDYLSLDQRPLFSKSEIIVALAPFGISTFLVVFVSNRDYLFDTWKQVVFASVAYLAFSIVLTMCFSIVI